MPKSKITPEQFVEIWQTSNTLAEVASKMGIKPKICSTRASLYRKKGVPLKYMARDPRRRIDWDELAAYARSLEKPDA